MKHLLVPCWRLAVVLSVYTALAVGQTSTARLAGLITDETGAVLPGVQVVIHNVQTGVARTVTSDDRGRYVAPELPPGAYEITATMTGFDTLVRSGITLTVGQDAAINLTMQVGSVTTQVTVTGEAPLVNTTSSGVSGVVEEKRITELPLNGRDFSQLALVQPGAISIRGADAAASKGFGSRISLAGSRAEQTGWLLDGSNINSVGNFGTPGSAANVMMGVDAVREFRVISGGGYSAEFGGYSGGMVQMVTKSGTNAMHGSVYGFHRNDNLDARSFFDKKKPEFRRNQFGAAVGGAIQQDKAFYFGNFEGLRQAKVGETRLETVPDENVHRGLIPAAGGGLQQVNISPAIRPYLDLYPLPNGENLGNGLARLLTPITQVTNENFFVIRSDYYLTPNQNLFARFSYDNADDRLPAGLDISDTVITSRTRYALVQYEHIVSSTLLSTSRVGFNRTNISPTIDVKIDYPRNLYFMHHEYPATFSYTGITSLGVSSNNTTNRIQNLYEVGESMVYSKGNHSLKFGGAFQKTQFNGSGPAAGAFGSFSWNSVGAFLQDQSMESLTTEIAGASTTRSVRQKILGLYIQDDWRWRPNFTLNLGLRYEPWSGPGERWGRVSTIKRWIEATEFDTPDNGTETFFDSPGERSFSPRIGIAWDVRGNGKTAVRAGFGIFHQLILSNYLNTIARKNPPYSATLISSPAPVNFAGSVAYVNSIGPSLLSKKLTPQTFSEFIQWDLNSPIDIKYNLSIEREVLPDLAITVGYVGNRGIHQLMKSDANAAPPILVNGRPFVSAGTPRLNPNNGVATYQTSEAMTFYNAFMLEVKKRLSHGFQAQGAYTWSKNIDDATTGLANTDYLEGVRSQPYSARADRGLSALHLAHNLVLNGILEVPSPFSSGIGSKTLGGWQISSIFSISSGAPVPIQISGRNAPDLSRSAGRQRPELVEGRNNSNLTSGVSAGCTFGPGANQSVPAGEKLGTINRYYDPCAFYLPPAGFYGSAGRNIMLGQGFVNLDFSLLKNTPLGISEGSRLQLHVDFFNFLNHPNFGRPSINVLNAQNRANPFLPEAGRITTTLGRERQIQFGLKLIF